MHARQDVPIIWHQGWGRWDTALPRFILDGTGRALHFSKLDWIAGLQDHPIGVIVIPGQHSTRDYDQLNIAGRSFQKLLWIIVGDEENLFRPEYLSHPHSKTWWFAPPLPIKIDRACIFGWPTDAPEMIAKARQENPYRDLDWSFQGQMTHIRRQMCVAALQEIPNGELLPTAGFLQGVPREEYYRTMARSKLVPCPSGPATPDSFRFAEALESGCIPIADDRTPHASYPAGYFRSVLGEQDLPFPIISDWGTLPDVMAQWLVNWKEKSTRCQKWWAAKKQQWITEMREDFE